MKAISISGSPRVNVGKRNATDIRKNGEIPCVLYGGKEQIHFSAPYIDFKKLVYTPDVFTVELSIEGKTYKALMQDIQFDPISDRIIHIDFIELKEDKPVIIDIPVKMHGVSPGVKQGGKLLTPVRKLKIKAFPKDLPDSIPVSIDSLEIGQSFKVEQLSIDGVKFLDAPNVVIASVRMTRNVATDAAAAAAAAGGKAAPAKKK